MGMTIERSIRIHYTIPNLIIALSSIILNTFLIMALRKLNKMNTISYKLVAVLSVSDILVGVALLVTEPCYLLISRAQDQFMLNICTGISLYACCQFSGFMIISITVDRFIHMKYPVDYAVIVTNRRAVKLVVFNITISLLLVATYVCSLIYHFVFVYYLSLAVIASFAFICLSILYYTAFKSMRTRIASIEAGRSNKHSVTVNRNSSQEFSRTVMFILGSLWLCYSPFVASSIIRHSSAIENTYAVFVGFFSSELLIYTNSTINAILFIAFNRQLRKFAFSALRCRCTTPG